MPEPSWIYPLRSREIMACGQTALRRSPKCYGSTVLPRAMFGKYHEAPPWEVSVSGPYDRWPTRSGFDKFYGFIGGETNQWAPAIFDGVVRVEHERDPNYHFTTDMTNQAIGWARFQKSMTPDKPFYMYFAPGATHAPHHVPAEYAAKYRGKFDGGWDRLRD